jgi:hypothetical protein
MDFAAGMLEAATVRLAMTWKYRCIDVDLTANRFGQIGELRNIVPRTAGVGWMLRKPPCGFKVVRNAAQHCTEEGL